VVGPPRADIETQLPAEAWVHLEEAVLLATLMTSAAGYNTDTADIANHFTNHTPCALRARASADQAAMQLELHATRTAGRGECCCCCLKSLFLYYTTMIADSCAVAAGARQPTASTGARKSEMSPDLPPGQAPHITSHWAQSLPQLTWRRLRKSGLPPVKLAALKAFYL